MAENIWLLVWPDQKKYKKTEGFLERAGEGWGKTICDAAAAIPTENIYKIYQYIENMPRYKLYQPSFTPSWYKYY